MADQPAPRPGRSDWRRDPRLAGAGSGRGPLRALVLIAFLAVAGALVALYFWFAPATPPQLLTVPVSEYTDAVWPANPFAEQDSELLRSAFPESEKAFNFQERDRLVTKLESLRGASGQAIVLHISALAATRDGVVYLLPGQARPDDPDTWLKLADVLAAFGACPAKHKLLLLDVARPLADPFRGPLVDDVADRLHAELTKAKPNYLVLASCGPGEVSLPLDDEPASAFAYYAVQGLTGAADRSNAANASDGRVSARELAAFVGARVNRWAAQARGARQTPALYGPDGYDFPLTFAARSAPESASAGAYPAPLLAGWQRRDTARADGAPQRAPAAFALLESTLLRAERAWAAGLGTRVESRLGVELDALQAPLDAGRRAEPAPLRSLVATPGKTPPPELVKALETYLARRFLVPPVKAEELQKDLEAFLNAAKGQGLEAGKLIWEKLLIDPQPAEARARELAALFDQVQPPASEEGLLLKRLAAWKPRSINWPAAAVHTLIEAENAAGLVFALLPAGFPWARASIAAADKAKLEGERRLFEANSTLEARAAADRLAQARNGFTTARKQLELVQTARRTLADAAVILSATGPGVVASDADIWRTTAETAATVADLLTRPPDGQSLPPTLEDQLFDFQSSLRSLEGPFAPATVQKRIAASATGGVTEYQALRALLRGPLLKAPERKVVWEAAAKLSRKLHDDVLKFDGADDASHRALPAPTPALPDADEAQRGGRRARVSVGLLRLASVDGDRLDAVRRAATAASPDWPALAADLRDAWTKRRPEQYRQRVAKDDWPAADRLARGPGLLGVGTVERAEMPPAVRLRQQEEQACRQWLEEHYKDYRQLRASVKEAIALYEDAAADCRR